MHKWLAIPIAKVLPSLNLSKLYLKEIWPSKGQGLELLKPYNAFWDDKEHEGVLYWACGRRTSGPGGSIQVMLYTLLSYLVNYLPLIDHLWFFLFFIFIFYN